MDQQQEFEQYDKSKQYPRHEIAYSKGGIHNSKEKSSISASVATDFFGKISAKVMKGEIKNMMNLSKPVKMCTHQTFQEIVAYDNSQTQFLDKAYQYTLKKDPIKRLQMIAAFAISSVHICPSLIYTKIPLDPTNIGETCQMYKPNSKHYFYSEATSVLPPVCRSYITSENGEWKICMTQKLWGKLDLPKMNSMQAKSIGTKFIEFKEEDGRVTSIEVENMLQIFEGLIMGERLTKPTGSFKIKDNANKLMCQVKFSYEKTSTMNKLSNMMGGLWGSKKKEEPEQKPVEYFDCNIFKVTTLDEKSDGYQEIPLSSGFGNYVEYFQMDGNILWKANDAFEPFVPITNQTELLQSDCTWLELKTLMQMQDYDKAQKEQKKQDQQNANDDKLRKQARKIAKEKGLNVFDKTEQL